MVNKLFTILFLALLSLPSWAAVSAQVNRTELYNDESLLLTVTVTPNGDLSKSDISALESLFVIENRYQQSSSQTINGRRTSRVDYQFQIRPKKTGALGIPNFHVGNEQSQPILIRVLDASQRKDFLEEDAAVFSATLSSTSPYIDQPIYLTLEFAYKIQIQNGSIDGVTLDGFDVTLLDEKQTQENRNGQTYNVYRRVIELVPKKAGLFTIPDLNFSAEYPNNQLGRFVRFARKAQVPAIEVKSIPAEFPANEYWLPLKNLTVQDNLPNVITTNQNEHLNWNLTLTAEGLSASRLPDVLQKVENSLSTDIKLYKNAPKITQNQRIESAALSFITPGPIDVSEIKIPWWNVQTDTLEWAVISAKKVTVSPASVLQAQTNSSTEAASEYVNAQSETGPSPLWKWVSLMTALGWLLTGLAWFYLDKKSNESRSKKTKEIIKSTRKKSVGLKPLYQDYLNLGINTQELNVFLDPSELKRLKELETYLFRGSETRPEESEIRSLIQKLKNCRDKKKEESSSNDFSLLPTLGKT
jgi:hypothetical protein